MVLLKLKEVPMEPNIQVSKDINTTTQPVQALHSSAPQPDLKDLSASGAYARNAAQAEDDTIALVHYALGGDEPEATPLIDRPASFLKKMHEFNQIVYRAAFSKVHYHGPFDELLTKAWGIGTLLNPLARLSFARDEDGFRNEAIQEHANLLAHSFGARKPEEFIKKGRLEDALSSYAKATNAAPHRLDEMYQVIGGVCEFLHRLKIDTRSGNCRMQLELDDHFGMNGLTSPLKRNVINHAGGGYSLSSVTEGSKKARDEANIPALTQALRESSIPFAAIARAAYRRVIENHEVEAEFERNRGGFGGDSPEAREQQRHMMHARIEWMNGDYQEALTHFEKAHDLVKGSSFRPQLWGDDWDFYVRLLKDAGKTKEALDQAGVLLRHVVNGPSERQYLEFIDLCEVYSKECGLGEDKWTYALPFLKAVCEREEESHEGESFAYEAYSFLGQAYVGIGDSVNAREAFEHSDRIIEWRSPESEDVRSIHSVFHARLMRFKAENLAVMMNLK